MTKAIITWKVNRWRERGFKLAKTRQITGRHSKIAFGVDWAVADGYSHLVQLVPIASAAAWTAASCVPHLHFSALTERVEIRLLRPLN